MAWANMATWCYFVPHTPRKEWRRVLAIVYIFLWISRRVLGPMDNLASQRQVVKSPLRKKAHECEVTFYTKAMNLMKTCFCNCLYLLWISGHVLEPMENLAPQRQSRYEPAKHKCIWMRSYRLSEKNLYTHSHPLSTLYTHSHPISLLLTQSHPFSPTLTHSHLFSLILAHSHPFSLMVPPFDCFASGGNYPKKSVMRMAPFAWALLPNQFMSKPNCHCESSWLSLFYRFVLEIPKSVDPQSVDPQSISPQCVAPQSVVPQSVDPQSVNHQCNVNHFQVEGFLAQTV